ncbi:Hypp1143 [Branchiostoma lanceolatum]|uniref:Hypp1143 protein n=1 Tax=Branchiostoma lanceolatum TaxID=7740 RepID=A0A8J9ZHV3_BRALA|nr:Hypp1143 [Branchiostoma lanceolatum]
MIRQLARVWPRSVRIENTMNSLTPRDVGGIGSERCGGEHVESRSGSQVFRPPLDIYDAIIHLNPRNVPRRSEGVDHWKLGNSKDVPIDEGVGQGGKEILPVVKFDPVITLNGRTPDLDQSGEDMMMIPNVAAILEDFNALRKGLVKTVDVRRERPFAR